MASMWVRRMRSGVGVQEGVEKGPRGTPVNRLSRSATGNGIREEVFKLYSGNSGISRSLDVGV